MALKQEEVDLGTKGGKYHSIDQLHPDGICFSCSALLRLLE
jgi:hypothetical protein